MSNIFKKFIVGTLVAGQLAVSTPVYSTPRNYDRIVTIRNSNLDVEIKRKLEKLTKNEDKLSLEDQNKLKEVFSQIQLSNGSIPVFLKDELYEKVNHLWEKYKSIINKPSSRPITKETERKPKKITPIKTEKTRDGSTEKEKFEESKKVDESSKSKTKSTKEKTTEETAKLANKYRQIVSNALEHTKMEHNAYSVDPTSNSITETKIRITPQLSKIDDNTIIEIGKLVGSNRIRQDELAYTIVSINYIPEAYRARYVREHLPEVLKRVKGYAVLQVIQITGLVLKSLNKEDAEGYLDNYVKYLDEATKLSPRDLVPRLPQTGIVTSHVSNIKREVIQNANQGVWIRLSETTFNRDYYADNNTNASLSVVRVIMDPVLAYGNLTSSLNPISLYMYNFSARMLNNPSSVGRIRAVDPGRAKRLINSSSINIGIFPVRARYTLNFLTPHHLYRLIPKTATKKSKKFKKGVMVAVSGYGTETRNTTEAMESNQSGRNTNVGIAWSNEDHKFKGYYSNNTSESEIIDKNSGDSSKSTTSNTSFAVDYENRDHDSIVTYGNIYENSTTTNDETYESEKGSVYWRCSSISHEIKGMCVGEYRSDYSTGSSDGTLYLGSENLLWGPLFGRDWTLYLGTATLTPRNSPQEIVLQDMWNIIKLDGYLMKHKSLELTNPVIEYYGIQRYSDYDINLSPPFIPANLYTLYGVGSTVNSNTSLFLSEYEFSGVEGWAGAGIYSRLSSLNLFGSALNNPVEMGYHYPNVYNGINVYSVYPSSRGLITRHPYIEDELKASDYSEGMIGVQNKDRTLEAIGIVGESSEGNRYGARGNWEPNKHIDMQGEGYRIKDNDYGYSGNIEINGNYLDGFVAMAYFMDGERESSSFSGNLNSKELEKNLGEIKIVVPYRGKAIHRKITLSNEPNQSTNVSAIQLMADNVAYFIVSSKTLEKVLNTDKIYGIKGNTEKINWGILGGNNLISAYLLGRIGDHLTLKGRVGRYDRPFLDYLNPVRQTFRLSGDLDTLYNGNYISVYNLWLDGIYQFDKETYLGGIGGLWRSEDIDLKGLELDLFFRTARWNGILAYAQDEFTLGNYQFMNNVLRMGGGYKANRFEISMLATLDLHNLTTSGDLFTKLTNYGIQVGMMWQPITKVKTRLGLEMGVMESVEENQVFTSEQTNWYILGVITIGETLPAPLNIYPSTNLQNPNQF